MRQNHHAALATRLLERHFVICPRRVQIPTHLCRFTAGESRHAVFGQLADAKSLELCVKISRCDGHGSLKQTRELP
eukprot:SAG31_NODE_35_length_31836_cov_10.841352_11_plen_76_part_00